MPSPFRGMDPYVEHPALWPDVHNAMIAALRARLGPALRPRYVVRLEQRAYLDQLERLAYVGRPDVAVRPRRAGAGGLDVSEPPPGSVLSVEVPVPDRVRETYLEVREPEGNHVITALEILSPGNKRRAGCGRRRYEAKRNAVLESRTHLVEIDLLRAGHRMPVHGADRAGATWDYSILVSRADTRPRAELVVFGVREPIPVFRLPLAPDDDEPRIDLGAVLAEVFAQASYDLSIDYRADPVPPLEGDDASWARTLLATGSG